VFVARSERTMYTMRKLSAQPGLHPSRNHEFVANVPFVSARHGLSLGEAAPLTLPFRRVTTAIPDATAEKTTATGDTRAVSEIGSSIWKRMQ
jgi:hypothetical protein